MRFIVVVFLLAIAKPALAWTQIGGFVGEPIGAITLAVGLVILLVMIARTQSNRAHVDTQTHDGTHSRVNLVLVEGGAKTETVESELSKVA